MIGAFKKMEVSLRFNSYAEVELWRQTGGTISVLNTCLVESKCNKYDILYIVKRLASEGWLEYNKIKPADVGLNISKINSWNLLKHWLKLGGINNF